ncbi:complement C4-B [Aulostomus maculatus]
MKRNIFPTLLLIGIVGFVQANRFFISGPSVFHVGVKEKVFVQMGGSQLHNTVYLYLEHESSGSVVSTKEEAMCTSENDIKTVELMIDRQILSRLPKPKHEPNYLLLVAESPSFSGKKKTKVLISKHRGHIFIQTDQPIYNPTQTVRYRIFTLDKTFRPQKEIFHISIVNSAGNRIMKSFRSAEGGIFKGTFVIPDVSKMGTWKIMAHYEGDEKNVALREFKVQKFVLPSFEVGITMDQRYILVNDEHLNFTISAKYSHGEKVRGAYHCRFGVLKKATSQGQKAKPIFVRGLELTGLVEEGTATASLSTAKLNTHFEKQLKESLSDLQGNGEQLYLGVFVTNIQSGEIQESEVFLPVISHRYTMDLSRTRSYFLPGYPLDVVVLMRNPDGSPAVGVPVKVDVARSSEKSWQGITDQEGAATHVFNIVNAAEVAVEVSADGLQQRKIIRQVSSPSNSYLYLSFTYRTYSVNDAVSITYNTINSPNTGNIYYMVLSRGILVKSGFLTLGTSVKDNLKITPDMVPSLRLIGYFYNQHGDIIADSVWIDVRDECEIKVRGEIRGSFLPGRQAELEFDLHGQRAKVALLAVDKAFYGLNTDNKLTPKQVFSSMQSRDLGCTYGGGPDQDSVLVDAGLSFVSQAGAQWRKRFHCDSPSARQKRSDDMELMSLISESNFTDPNLQDCCTHGFSLCPMRRTCQERLKRVSQVGADPACADAFLKCCNEGEKWRKKKMDAEKGLGRTANIADIEDFFYDSANQYIRRFFPPSFAFMEFDVNDKGRQTLPLPDSITTWEIQIVTLSAATGFCVVKPWEVRAFKNVFVSLRMPYSVKRYEQLSISPVIYNYGTERLHVAVHMEQTEGLCSPGSASTTAFVNITVEPSASQFVSFSAVPMVTGVIPIKIRLYDIEKEMGIDAIEKPLNVWAEGIEKRVEETKKIKLDGTTRTKSINIDATLPSEVVPDTSSNIFFSMEEDGFRSSHVQNLLSPKKVADLIVLPTGCLEQTMSRLTPTALALRYLDLSEQWFDLPASARDDALDKIQKGIMRIILEYKKPDGSYGAWYSVPSSNWVTALVVKVFSLVAERQSASVGLPSRQGSLVNEEEIRQPARVLLSVQNNDGSFGDQHPVLHRGILQGKDQSASMTAFITLALHRSLQFLQNDQSDAEAKISRAITYLQSNFEDLQNPYAVAIVAYCLSVCQPEGTDVSAAWDKLQAMASEGENGCYVWTTSANKWNGDQADAFTIETTAYALLTAVAQGKKDWADKAACWLTTQENYFGGYRSSQDTVMALESLSEYELMKTTSPEANVIAEISVPGKREIIRLSLEKRTDKVEADLKKLSGNNILVQLTGNGDVKLKIVKAYYLLEPKSDCDILSISVEVGGKVKYTANVIENYEYYDDSEMNGMDPEVPQSVTDWSAVQTRTRRDLGGTDSDGMVSYTVCVSHSLNSSLSGMGIADITLLSGFEAVIEDLERLKLPPEQYISHYEVSYGRVLIYFNELFQPKECISFDAVQRVPIGLLQPAPASFYDYYEPNRKCTVFYSAPKRSKMVSTLCSEDVCQCAERPCYKLKSTFKGERGQTVTKNDRMQHACFFHIVDYAYLVEVVSVSSKSNFDLYRTNVFDVLRSNGDMLVREGLTRVFAKRRQCKGELEVGKMYLIMGKDGATLDSNGEMQYLLESSTWVEKRPSEEECQKSAHKMACRGFDTFLADYKMDGCRQ